MPTDAWNFARAALVPGPNVWISFPGDPFPVFETMNPDALRNFCRVMMSPPLILRERVLVKENVFGIIVVDILLPSVFVCVVFGIDN